MSGSGTRWCDWSFCADLCSTQRSSSEHHPRSRPVKGEFSFFLFCPVLHPRVGLINPPPSRVTGPGHRFPWWSRLSRSPCRGLWENLAADSAIKRNWLAPKVRFGAFCWRTWRWHWSCLIIYWSKWWMCVSVYVFWPKYNLMLTSVRYSSDSAAQFLIENTSLFSWTVAKMRLFYKPMILKRLKRRSDAKFVRVWSCYSNLITGSLIDLGLNTVLQWFFWSLHFFDVTNQPAKSTGFPPCRCFTIRAH